MFPKQMVFSALALAQCEVIWYFQHVGIASSKSKTSRVVPVDIVSICFNILLLYVLYFPPLWSLDMLIKRLA